MHVDTDAVVVRRIELEYLQDRLYVLRSAVEELDRSVKEKASLQEMTTVAKEVVAATGDLDKLWIVP
ncbi:hypothetical protein CLV47_11410 [Antricoccus suffuscus]|uniref:Uncharacterized protein n=1 Tax=Antricoccus suffuscus TaxID=1629062 RepID=A0A2T0ZWK3_9ACTN|nr:hypothetical protein [Antricoccus suffuscus]PRZ40713.1 hypothetical protein CLV47_11410 [Antricoccus suffuscus]